MAITKETIAKDVQVVSNMQEQLKQQDPFPFPYKTRLSLHRLIERWKQDVDSEDLHKALVAKEIMKRLESVPGNLEDLSDPVKIEEHRELINLMLSGLFPILNSEEEMIVIGQPFSYNFLYRSSKMEEIMSSTSIKVYKGNQQEDLMKEKIISAGVQILNKFYGQHIQRTMDMNFTIQQEDTGLDCYYRGLLDLTYVDIIQTAPLKEISKAVMRKLISNVEDVDFWLENIPVDNFEFAGMVQVQVTDVTQEKTYNNLKLALLEKNAIVDAEKFSTLENQMRNYLRSPDLKIGIAGKGYGGDQFGLDSGLWNCLVPMKLEYFIDRDHGNLYKKVIEKGKLTVIDDLRNYPDPSGYEKELLKAGYVGLIISPMKDEEGNFVGVFELGNKQAFGFHAERTEKLREILPMFTVALQRAIEEKGNQVDVLIKQKYTSIHPSVEWRFIKAANDLIRRRQLNPDYDTPEPISFKDVYPLYGQSDIVGSSSKRNAAIQKDLITNLQLLKKTLEPIEACMGFPLIGVYQHRVDTFIENLKKNVNSGDEVRVTEFLTEEIQPLLENMSKQSPDFENLLEPYRKELDPEMKVVYKNRRAYEDSVTFLNETLSRLMDQYQVEAQQVLPHYFEMYKTDGIEYNLYMGASMLNGQAFDEKYIENIRLWQLMAMIAVTRKVHEIQPKLQLPLKTAELILAFSNRIAIRFKTEEKQFDVDGAYNVRYEVIKKRIDKSKIKGTNERLTQAGKIAIVYTQDKERFEYLQFFDYLKAKGMIEEEIEELLIDDLQGVSGLRALRVKVIV